MKFCWFYLQVDYFSPHFLFLRSLSSPIFTVIACDHVNIYLTPKFCSCLTVKHSSLHTSSLCLSVCLSTSSTDCSDILVDRRWFYQLCHLVCISSPPHPQPDYEYIQPMDVWMHTNVDESTWGLSVLFDWNQQQSQWVSVLSPSPQNILHLIIDCNWRCLP